MFDYRIYEIGDTRETTVVELTGRLDNDATDYFFECLQGLVEQESKQVIIDCGKLEYITSLGLGTLVRAHSRLAKIGGNVKLANVPGIIAEVMSLVRLNQVFHMYSSVAEAEASFSVSH